MYGFSNSRRRLSISIVLGEGNLPRGQEEKERTKVFVLAKACSDCLLIGMASGSATAFIWQNTRVSYRNRWTPLRRVPSFDFRSKVVAQQ